MLPQLQNLLQRNRSFWPVTLHDRRHYSQRQGVHCSRLTDLVLDHWYWYWYWYWYLFVEYLIQDCYS